MVPSQTVNLLTHILMPSCCRCITQSFLLQAVKIYAACVRMVHEPVIDRGDECRGRGLNVEVEVAYRIDAAEFWKCIRGGSRVGN